MPVRPLEVDMLDTDQLWRQLVRDINVMQQYLLGQVEYARLRYVIHEAQDIVRELVHRGEQHKLF